MHDMICYLCIIIFIDLILGKAGYPNHVIKHKLNETSLDLSWNPPSFTGGAGVPVDHYNLTVSPPPSIDPCRTGYCIVKSTNITFHGLKKCSSFDITITPINCNGLGSLLKLPVISSKTCVHIKMSIYMYKCTCRGSCQSSQSQ